MAIGLPSLAHIVATLLCLLLAVLRLNYTVTAPWIQLASPLMIVDIATLLGVLKLTFSDRQRRPAADTVTLSVTAIAVALKLAGEVFVALRLDGRSSGSYVEAVSPLLASLLLVLLMQTMHLAITK